MFYCDLYSKMKTLWMLLSHFETCQLEIFEIVDLGRGYLHLLEALKEEKATWFEKGGRGWKHMADPVEYLRLMFWLFCC